MAVESNAAQMAEIWEAPNFDKGGGGAGMPAPPATIEGGEDSGFTPVTDGMVITQEGFEEGGHDTGRDPGEPDFAAIKFQRENTLLSNSEMYAESIQQEAELYVAQMRKEVDELNRQAEDRYKEATQAKDEAVAEAEKMVSDAEEQVEEIRLEAHKEGFEEGKLEGMRKRYEEAGDYLKNIEAILKELSQFRRQVAYYAEKDAVRLAMLMTKKVLQQELKINPKAILKILAQTLSTLRGQGNFTVWVSPDDYQFALKARPSLQRYLDSGQVLVFRAKPELPPGNVQIETDREVIDHTFQSQFHYLEGTLNQALAERETMVMKRPPTAMPPVGSGDASVPAPPTANDSEDHGQPQPQAD